MKLFINGKKGEELLSLWMFLIWIIVGVAVVVVILAFFSSLGDVRGFQANAIADNIIACLTDGSSFNKNAFNDNFDFFKECRIKKNNLEGSRLFYINVTIRDADNNVKEIISGDHSLITLCELNNFAEGKQVLPSCITKKIIAVYTDDFKLAKRTAEIDILVASNNLGGKV